MRYCSPLVARFYTHAYLAPVWTSCDPAIASVKAIWQPSLSACGRRRVPSASVRAGRLCESACEVSPRKLFYFRLFLRRAQCQGSRRKWSWPRRHSLPAPAPSAGEARSRTRPRAAPGSRACCCFRWASSRASSPSAAAAGNPSAPTAATRPSPP
ncbi:uncharacterized protein LOC134782943 isoform X2 [Penaeus indicus]|uniref:uncharacterized protein LOC134782943 isoform X2 n=1 Tax=Penaeus indicus TaxID=29960 RepID=UPI00300D44DB